MSAPEEIYGLIERFARNLDTYRSGRYNEAQVRQEFINPFFNALGWDIYNKKGYAEVYKDVIHEDAIRVDSAVKAPDYCFRIGGTRKFFLEVKKTAVNIREEVNPAYQLRRYAWSAKLPETKTILQRRIETTDRQIDRLVYELYDLTEHEIKIVEGN